MLSLYLTESAGWVKQLATRDRSNKLTGPPQPRNRRKSLAVFGETVLGAQEELGGVLGHPRHPAAGSDRIWQIQLKIRSQLRAPPPDIQLIIISVFKTLAADLEF